MADLVTQALKDADGDADKAVALLVEQGFTERDAREAVVVEIGDHREGFARV